MEALKTVTLLKPSDKSDSDVNALKNKCYEAINDDLNTPQLIAHLFEAVRVVNSVNDGHETLTANDINNLTETLQLFVTDILGLSDETQTAGDTALVEGLMDTILALRKEARARKDWASSDLIRDQLKAVGIQVKDTKDGVVWSRE
jgi:cysteinyl-tRNA synthetase